MTIIEAIGYRLQRPGHLLILPGRHVVDISRTDHLIQAGKRSFDYARFSCSDLLALTWEVWLPQQLQEYIERQNGGE